MTITELWDKAKVMHMLYEGSGHMKKGWWDYAYCKIRGV
jgi:hypothetical protein